MAAPPLALLTPPPRVSPSPRVGAGQAAVPGRAFTAVTSRPPGENRFLEGRSGGQTRLGADAYGRTRGSSRAGGRAKPPGASATGDLPRLGAGARRGREGDLKGGRTAGDRAPPTSAISPRRPTSPQAAAGGGPEPASCAKAAAARRELGAAHALSCAQCTPGRVAPQASLQPSARSGRGGAL